MPELPPSQPETPEPVTLTKSSLRLRPAVDKPPSAFTFVDDLLDASFVGNHVELVMPGTDKVRVECSPVGGAWGAAVLGITVGGEGAAGVAPTGAAAITSTTSTWDQPELPAAGRSHTRVTVTTAASGVLIRVRITAMKS